MSALEITKIRHSPRTCIDGQILVVIATEDGIAFGAELIIFPVFSLENNGNSYTKLLDAKRGSSGNLNKLSDSYPMPRSSLGV